MKSRKIIFVLSILLVLTALGCSSENQSGGEQNKTNTKTSYFYTANEGGSISKVNALTNKEVKIIDVKGAVHNVQVSPDGKILGATLVPKDSEHVSEEKNHEKDKNKHTEEAMKSHGFALLYDTSTDKLIKEIPVGMHPAHIVFTFDGKYALVTNNEDNNISVINMKTFEVTKTIGTGEGPHGFRISKDNKYAYVANMGEDTVSIINLQKLREERRIRVGKSPVTTAITGDGKTLLTTLNAENKLVIVNLDTFKIQKLKVGKGPAQVYIQSDDKYAFVANQGTVANPSNTLSKIDISSRKVVATIEVGKGAHGIVVSNDNKYVFVTNMFEDTVSVVDNKENRVVTTISVGRIPNGISYKD